MLSMLLRKPVRIDLSDRADPALPRTAALSREQMIDRIIALNPSASAAFLDQFNDDALDSYLDHLYVAARPRGPETGRVRASNTPWAFAGRACA